MPYLSTNPMYDPMADLEEWEQDAPGERQTAGQTGIVHKLKWMSTNKFGVEPIEYELTDIRCGKGKDIPTGWKKYRCHCREEFWSKDEAAKIRGCKECLAGNQTIDDRSFLDPGTGRPRARLQLKGMRIGSLQVMGTVKGKGWMVECDCGRQRMILNGTGLARGAYKTCGQCKEHERHPASAGAPPPDLRSAVVACKCDHPKDFHGNFGCQIKDCGCTHIYPAVVAGDITVEMRDTCSTDHAPIAFYRSLTGGDCPLCLLMAKIELLQP